MRSGLLVLLFIGRSQSRRSHMDRGDPPIRRSTMADEGRGFATSVQLHPSFFRLLSKTIIDELAKGSLFCPPFFLFFSSPPLLVVFYF